MSSKLLARYALAMHPEPWSPPPAAWRTCKKCGRWSGTARLSAATLTTTPDSSAALLETIPGIGTATAAWLLTLLSEHRSSTSAKQAVAFAGLAPKIRQSGESAGKAAIAKNGDPLLRKALYMPALAAMTFNPPSAPSASASRPAASPASPGAAMRKLVHIAFAILRSGKPFGPECKPA